MKKVNLLSLALLLAISLSTVTAQAMTRDENAENSKSTNLAVNRFSEFPIDKLETVRGDQNYSISGKNLKRLTNLPFFFTGKYYYEIDCLLLPPKLAILKSEKCSFESIENSADYDMRWSESSQRWVIKGEIPVSGKDFMINVTRLDKPKIVATPVLATMFGY